MLKVVWKTQQTTMPGRSDQVNPSLACTSPTNTAGDEAEHTVWQQKLADIS